MYASLLYLASAVLAAALVAINAAQGAPFMALLWAAVLGIDYRHFVWPGTRGTYSPFWSGMYAAIAVINVVSAVSVGAEKGVWAAAPNIICSFIAVLWLLQQRSLIGPETKSGA